MGSKFCAFLAPYLVNWRKEDISDFFFFFCDYHLFSSFVVVTMKERMKEVSLFSKDRKTLFLRAFEKSLFGVTKLSLGICED